MEEWREIEEPGYFVSNLGRVKNPAGDLVLGAIDNPNDPARSQYMRVHIKGGNYRIHRLVCTAFHGEPPTRQHQAAHNNGDSLNNHADNLRWATHKENMADRELHGKNGVHSGKNPVVKLNFELADEIRAKLVGWKPGDMQLVAAEYGIHPSAVSRIVNNKIWVQDSPARG